jgi:hypothetical protein
MYFQLKVFKMKKLKMILPVFALAFGGLIMAQQVSAGEDPKVTIVGGKHDGQCVSLSSFNRGHSNHEGETYVLGCS